MPARPAPVAVTSAPHRSLTGCRFQDRPSETGRGLGQPLVSAVGSAADLVELGEIVVGQRESRAGGVLAQVCHR
ncbi:hypothetical protein CP967_00370 [Streptomyces nitrosporeus]|uniref:Uncharacterized protein n=1 Tax=Streptomyces nitrosporeus TaxID=28894 RepID=A0A5J6F397_9ACTN|nr:hypothetical protein CP967_00370 [Streptomyces nitrosporeus]